MSVDLIDRLIGDILQTTEILMKADEVDLSALAAPSNPRIEKRVQSMGLDRRPAHDMNSKGILHATC